MLSLKTKLATGLSTAGILAASLTPAAALAQDVSVTDTGAKSVNVVSVSDVKFTSIDQSNVMKVNTVVNQSANTGGNSQSFNTGSGGATMETGHATNTATVTVTGGNNVVTLPENCGCGEEAMPVSIEGTGAFSRNGVHVEKKKVMKVDQSGFTMVNTAVSQKSNSGKNKQSFNTGGGSKTMTTKNASNSMSVSVSSGNNRVN